jgi:SAM-dependent methyltransferase
MERLEDYSSVTEAPGTPVSREAIAMVTSRYAFAASLCEGRRVLEVACGPGVGLGWLSRVTSDVVGGDYTEALLREARAHYGDGQRLVRFDAHALPFADGAFEVVLLFEALYFFRDAARALAECQRVVAPGGLIVLVNANPERPGFNPAPYSTQYFTAAALQSLLETAGCTVDSYGAFPLAADGRSGRLLTAIRRVAVALRLVPRTMRGKALLKRLMYGTIVRFPAEVTSDDAGAVAPVPLETGAAGGEYKVIYTVATTPH